MHLAEPALTDMTPVRTGQTMQHSIQALRLFSALWVVIYHARDLALVAPADGLWHTFLSFGYLGVDIFFVISGYIMALNTATQPPGPRQALRFLATRCARIYSGWWPVFLLCLLVYGSTGQLHDKDLLGSFWLYQLNFNVLLLPVTWSLTFELYFYGIVALSLFLSPRWRPGIFWGFFLAITLANAWWLINDRYAVEQFEHSHYGMHLLLSPLCLEFLLGYLLQRHQSRMRKLSTPMQALLTLAAAALLYWYATRMAYKPSGLSGFFHFPERTLLAGLFAACMLSLFQTCESWLPRRLSLWGGDVSYLVYLLHLPVLWLFEYWAAASLRTFSPALNMLLVISTILLLSALLHCAIERPLYRWYKAHSERGFLLRRQ